MASQGLMRQSREARRQTWQAPALGREGAPAPPAGPPLGPVAVVALPDGGRPAPGTGLGGRIACGMCELPRGRRLRRIDEPALLPGGEPLHLMEYDIQHPSPLLRCRCSAAFILGRRRDIIASMLV